MSSLPLPAVGRMQRLAPDQQDTLREVGRRFREEAARAVTSIPLADALSPFGWHTWTEPAAGWGQGPAGPRVASRRTRILPAAGRCYKPPGLRVNVLGGRRWVAN